MEYRRLGKTGLQVSALSYGAWVTFGQQIDDKTAKALIKTAYDGGVCFFDNAEAYAAGRAEEVMGKALAELAFPRDTYCVSSKVFWGTHRSNHPLTRGLSRKHVTEACHAALERLRVDYLDLYFCHRPDLDTPIVETVAAMTDLIRQGKVLYWGTSEWTARDIALAHAAAREHGLYAPVMEQPQYNLFHRERVEVEYSRLYEDPGLGTTVWSPLASGLLSGKYLEGDPGDTRISVQGMEWLKERFQGPDFDAKCKVVSELGNLASEIGTTLPRLGLAWCLKNPHVSTAIMGASKVPQLEENLRAMHDVALLTDEVMDRIDAIAGTKPAHEERY